KGCPKTGRYNTSHEGRRNVRSRGRRGPPPRQQSDTPLARNRRLGRLCSGRVPVPLPKANPALVTKDGGTLRTGKDARAYMLTLSKQRETRAQRQQAAELLLDGATVADFSKAVELALSCDAKLARI